MTGQTTEPGTGGPLEDAVMKHAAILAPDEDNREEGEAKAKEEAETADEETEDEAAVDDPNEDTDDDAEDEDDEEADESDEDGEDDSDDEDDEDDDDAEPTFKVKVDGEEVEVTQSELIAGYARHADYTRKTTALANERKEFESEAESIRAERQQYAELLPKLKERLDKDGEQEPEDWDKLYREDPNEWMRQRELWRSRRERRQAIEAEEERVRQQQETDNQARMQAFVAEQSEKLASAIPEWADAEKAKAEKQAIAAYARDKLGYSDEELSQLYDHRAVVALRNAMLFEQARSQTGKGKGKRKGPRPAKPGAPKSGKTSQSRAEKERRQRFAKSGSVDDAADVLMGYVD